MPRTTSSSRRGVFQRSKTSASSQLVPSRRSDRFFQNAQLQLVSYDSKKSRDRNAWSDQTYIADREKFEGYVLTQAMPRSGHMYTWQQVELRYYPFDERTLLDKLDWKASESTVKRYHNYSSDQKELVKHLVQALDDYGREYNASWNIAYIYSEYSKTPRSSREPKQMRLILRGRNTPEGKSRLDHLNGRIDLSDPPSTRRSNYLTDQVLVGQLVDNRLERQLVPSQYVREQDTRRLSLHPETLRYRNDAFHTDGRSQPPRISPAAFNEDISSMGSPEVARWPQARTAFTRRATFHNERPTYVDPVHNLTAGLGRLQTGIGHTHNYNDPSAGTYIDGDRVQRGNLSRRQSYRHSGEDIRHDTGHYTYSGNDNRSSYGYANGIDTADIASRANVPRYANTPYNPGVDYPDRAGQAVYDSDDDPYDSGDDPYQQHPARHSRPYPGVVDQWGRGAYDTTNMPPPPPAQVGRQESRHASGW